MINSNGEGSQLVNFRISKEELKALDETFDHDTTTRAEVIRDMVRERIAYFKGKAQGAVTLESLNTKLSKAQAEEERLRDLLRSIQVGKAKYAFGELRELAKRLGTDDDLVKDINTVICKLKQYPSSYNPRTDHFALSHLFSFVVYLEKVLERRRLTEDIITLMAKQGST